MSGTISDREKFQVFLTLHHLASSTASAEAMRFGRKVYEKSKEYADAELSAVLVSNRKDFGMTVLQIASIFVLKNGTDLQYELERLDDLIDAMGE